MNPGWLSDSVPVPAPQALIAAAAAVTCADGTLGTKRAEVVRARRLAVHRARPAGWSTSVLADALGLPPRTVRRLATEHPPPPDVWALDRLLGLRHHLPGAIG